MPLTEHQERVADHVVATIGSIEGIVEIAPRTPEAPPIALLHVPATEHKPFQVLISAGLSTAPMRVPKEVQAELEKDGEDPAPERVELLLGLPPSWPVGRPEPEHAWPLRLLAQLASFPHEAGAWFMSGHTIPNFVDGAYAPTTQMDCALLAKPRNLLDEAMTIPLPEGPAEILGVVPLYPREVELKREQGVKRLLERLEEERVSEVLVPDREAVAGILLDLLKRT